MADLEAVHRAVVILMLLPISVGTLKIGTDQQLDWCECFCALVAVFEDQVPENTVLQALQRYDCSLLFCVRPSMTCQSLRCSSSPAQSTLQGFSDPPGIVALCDTRCLYLMTTSGLHDEAAGNGS